MAVAVFAIARSQANNMGVMSCLVCNHDNFDSFHLKILRIREKYFPVQSSVIVVNRVKERSEIVGT
jgi:hypothetical protein